MLVLLKVTQLDEGCMSKGRSCDLTKHSSLNHNQHQSQQCLSFPILLDYRPGTTSVVTSVYSD